MFPKNFVGILIAGTNNDNSVTTMKIANKCKYKSIKYHGRCHRSKCRKYCKDKGALIGKCH